VLVATPPPLVDVKPAREIRTLSPVNELAVDAGRAATLVGAAHGWEYLLVWSPKGVVVRATLNCDTQESNVVLAGNRFAHVCFQGGQSFAVAGTLKPLSGRVALRTAVFVALAGRGGLIAGTAGGVLWRIDAGGRTKLRSYPKPVIALDVDRGRILVEHDARTLEVVSSAGKAETKLTLAHGGGALMRAGRIATISNRRLVLTSLDGKTILTRAVVAGARLDDVDGAYAVYSVETRMHVLRLRDGRDIALRLRGQFGYASARLSSGRLFYAYNAQGGKTGRAGYVAVDTLFRR
jgi:hypothetical protein